MREVICGFLNGRKVVVDTTTGEASLLGDEVGKTVLTYISVSNPIDHSNDDVCQKLAAAWGVKGVIMASEYFVKLTDSTAQYFRVSDMTAPFFSTQYGVEIIEE